ncbi:hypothetical protein PTKIN_Ptkin05aG0222000 [Pterospermum kingtungense]
MEEKQRTCKICNRKFANGKAMGGHMRSHLAKLPIPSKLTLPSSSSTASLTCPANHMQPYRSINPELSSSETESSRNPTGRRSKRLRNFATNMVGSPSDSVSSVVFADETISCEDAAMCLLMMYRDKWSTPKKKQKGLDRWSAKQKQKQVDFPFYEDEDVGGEDVDFDDDDLFCVTNSDVKPHSKYKCESCNKVFKSHQALGGHKASHKNKQLLSTTSIVEDKNDNGDDQIYEQRIFECPFCDKVFQSGQALGGHKKVHFSYLAVARKPSSPVELFDLNLPVSEEATASPRNF